MRCLSGTSAGAALLTVLLGCNVVAATETPSQPAQRSEDGSKTPEQKALEAGVQDVTQKDFPGKDSELNGCPRSKSISI